MYVEMGYPILLMQTPHFFGYSTLMQPALELILSKLTPENGSPLDHFRVLMSEHSVVVVVVDVQAN